MQIINEESTLKVVELACFTIIVPKSFFYFIYSQILLYNFSYHHIVLITLG